MIPVMLIAIGVAYGIYFYNFLNQYYTNNEEPSRFEALRFTLNKLWKPLAMAAFTTMIGFVSLLSSQVYPIKYFGIFTALGILVAFALALVLLPAAVIIAGYKPRQKHPKPDKTNSSKNPNSNGLTNCWLIKSSIYCCCS